MTKPTKTTEISRVETFNGYAEATASIVCFIYTYVLLKWIELDENCLLVHENVHHLISAIFFKIFLEKTNSTLPLLIWIKV